MVELRAARILPTRRRLHRRMARACGRAFGAARSGNRPCLPRGYAGGQDRSALSRRRSLALIAAGLACLALAGAAEAQVIASRIWPARDYTRLTLESRAELKYEVFAVKDPERLVLDLETDVTPALAELDGKVAADDPYIKGLRVARNRPGVVRVVLDLKTEVKPQAFTLSPIAEYGHRLVLDIHPLVAADPLAELIAQGPPAATAPEKPAVARLAGQASYVKQTLLDLSQTATIDYSLRLGNSVLQRLGAVSELHKARVEQASFAVLKAQDVPSILVETAFISNPQEEKRLNDRGYQDKLARALLDGIRDYIARHPPRPASPLALN